MPTASPQRALQSASILLVDDNRDGVLARRHVLEELGYSVVPAHSAEDALRAAAELKFDLVITDFRMEPMNGVELIQALRQRNFQNPIILLSGFADTLGMNSENTGATVVIQKSANEVANLVRYTKRLLQAPKKPVKSQGPRGSGQAMN